MGGRPALKELAARSARWRENNDLPSKREGEARAEDGDREGLAKATRRAAVGTHARESCVGSAVGCMGARLIMTSELHFFQPLWRMIAGRLVAQSFL